MNLKEEDDNTNETRQLYLVDTPRDPLVSAGSIVDTTNDIDINQNNDLQTSALAGLMAGQSSSVCFPTKFSKLILFVIYPSTNLRPFCCRIFFLSN